MKKLLSLESIEKMLGFFFEKKLYRGSAAISYYLIMTLFPTLICIQWILSSVGEDIIGFLEGISEIIPANALIVIEEYLAYTETQTGSLLIIGILTAIYTGAAAFRTVSDTLREIFDSRGGNDTVRYIFSFVFAIAFLLAVYVLALMVITGRWLFNILEPYLLKLEALRFIDIAQIWNWLRFILLHIITSAMLFILYYFSAWRSPIRIRILPGAVFGSVVFTAVSGLFSLFITYSVKYSAVYGSLASVIILMLWLYILGNILIIGALINKEISEHRNDPKMKIHSNIKNFIKKQQ